MLDVGGACERVSVLLFDLALICIHVYLLALVRYMYVFWL